MTRPSENTSQPFPPVGEGTAQPNQGKPSLSSRRDFLKISAAAGLAAGAARPLVAAADASSAPPPVQGTAAAGEDAYALAARFNKFLRVTDVTDGLDAVGRADLTLLDAAIRPLWMGVRF